MVTSNALTPSLSAALSKVLVNPLAVLAGGYLITVLKIKILGYQKCEKKCECRWRMPDNHVQGYEYLNNACYLSGSFKLDCPDEKKGQITLIRNTVNKGL